MFKKILVANRGEIACRILRTARRMGLKTVAVASEADVAAPHVDLADESVVLGPPPAAQSYLDIAALVAAARETGAEAVHPGFGFLSENAAFAEALAAAGIVFVGPGVEAIRQMGDKIASKRLALKAGVSTVPGSPDAVADAKAAVAAARNIGYPVMLKASAGGGGKGMRIARNDAEVRDGFGSAANEARASFGDDRVFVEKFIEQPRHIEIQVLADGHGNTVHLGERECSIQRRHQKVIEEAPSPFLDSATREAMGAQAVALARAVDYVSAGTVEFIVDRERNFYFLEMNTRLQVEHPVTELVTGLDLVELMFRVAAGEALPFGQDDVRLDGWAVEARVYAEDPARGFMPSIGRLKRYREPVGLKGARFDSGVAEGAQIGIHYDPMIAKVAAHGVTREQAIERLRAALDGYLIRGVEHNIGFLAAVLAHPRFQEGRLSTDFIADEFPDGFVPPVPGPAETDLLSAVAAVVRRRVAERDAGVGAKLDGGGAPPGDAWVVQFDDVERTVALEPQTDGYDATVGATTLAIRTDWRPGQALFEATVQGHPMCVQVDTVGTRYRISHAGFALIVRVVSPHVAELAARMPKKPPPDLSRFLLSPMPGLLVSLAAEPGQAIKAGEDLAVVEAMKMENVLRAERDGTVAALHAAPGDSLAVDQAILEFE